MLILKGFLPDLNLLVGYNIIMLRLEIFFNAISTDPLLQLRFV
jgi:hypothetical protein